MPMTGRMPSAYLPLSARGNCRTLDHLALRHRDIWCAAQAAGYVWQSNLPNTGLQYPGGPIIVAMDLNGSRQSQSVTSMRAGSISRPGGGRQRWRHPFMRGRRRRSRKNTNVFAAGGSQVVPHAIRCKFEPGHGRTRSTSKRRQGDGSWIGQRLNPSRNFEECS
jgi:hypothetical protein